MDDRSDRFSDRLLALEQARTSDELRRRYEGAVQSLLERRLGPARRLLYAAVAVLGLVGAGVCASLAATEPAGTPPLTRAALTLCALFGASWFALAAAVLRRGSLHHRRHGGAAARMAFGFTLATVLLFSALAAASPGPATAGTLVGGLALLIAAAVVRLTHAIEASELRTREQALALELRLAQLGEALGAGR